MRRFAAGSRRFASCGAGCAAAGLFAMCATKAAVGFAVGLALLALGTALCGCLLALSRADEAMSLLQTNLETQEELLGPDDVETARTRGLFGRYVLATTADPMAAELHGKERKAARRARWPYP